MEWIAFLFIVLGVFGTGFVVGGLLAFREDDKTKCEDENIPTTKL